MHNTGSSKTLYGSFVAISTFHSGGMTLFDRQHMKQTVDAKVGRQVLQVSTARDSTFSSTLWACIDIMTYHGGRSFVECRLSSEDKSCVNMAAVLDLRMWSCTQNREFLHGDCSARFWYPWFKTIEGGKTNWLSKWKQQPLIMEPCDIKIPSLSDC